jgi:polyisoprenoid-binding protein YceI
MLRCICAVLTAAIVLSPIHAARAQNQIPNDVLRDGTLSFLGRASVGSFVGSTSMVSGAIVGGREIPETRGWVQAPVATLNTNNGRRDRDLRATMEVEKYPTMRFELDGASIVRVFSGPADSTAVLLHGTLTIHGVTKRVDLPAIVVTGSNVIHVASTFPLDLRDYGIGGLRRLFGLLRMEPQIEVRVDLHFMRAAAPVASANE